MVLQLPVENGYDGGRLKIEHRSSMTFYEPHEGSGNCHFLTAFRSGCKHELEPIKSGWRVTLMINLVWKNAFDVTKIPQSIPHIPEILELLTEIWESLDSWFRRIPQAKHDKPFMENVVCCDRLATSDVSLNAVKQLSKPFNHIECWHNGKLDKLSVYPWNATYVIVLAPAASQHPHEEFAGDVSPSSPFGLKISNIAHFYHRILESQQSITKNLLM